MEKYEYHSYSEGDDAAGGNHSGDPILRTTGLSKSPPRQCKEKGLTELGDLSLLQRRRSARLSKKQSLPGSTSHHREGKISSSISDGDIKDCNSRLYDQGTGAEPLELWEIGKLPVLIFHGDEEEVVKEYMCMEERDMEVPKDAKEGDKEGLSC